jgi:hypothetical protein
MTNEEKRTGRDLGTLRLVGNTVSHTASYQRPAAQSVEHPIDDRIARKPSLLDLLVLRQLPGPAENCACERRNGCVDLARGRGPDLKLPPFDGKHDHPPGQQVQGAPKFDCLMQPKRVGGH